MDPPKSLKDHLKDMWNKPASDFGLIGTLVAKGVSSATSAAVGGALSKQTQEENFSISIEDTFSYSNNLIEGDIDSKENGSNDGKDDYVLTNIKKYFDKLKSEIGNECLIDFNAVKSDENKYQVSIKANETLLVALNMEIENE